MTDDIPPGARNTDPGTSHDAAADNTYREIQRGKLFAAYRRDRDNGGHGLNAWEAANAAGLDPEDGNCYWKRVSELLYQGLIRHVYDNNNRKVKRPGKFHNRAREVYELAPPQGQLW